MKLHLLQITKSAQFDLPTPLLHQDNYKYRY